MCGWSSSWLQEATSSRRGGPFSGSVFSACWRIQSAHSRAACASDSASPAACAVISSAYARIAAALSRRVRSSRRPRRCRCHLLRTGQRLPHGQRPGPGRRSDHGHRRDRPADRVGQGGSGLSGRTGRAVAGAAERAASWLAAATAEPAAAPVAACSVRRVIPDGAPLALAYVSACGETPFRGRFYERGGWIGHRSLRGSVISAIGTVLGIAYTRVSASSDRISAIADQSALKVAREQLAIEQARHYKEKEERGEAGLRGPRRRIAQRRRHRSRQPRNPDDELGRADLNGGDLPGRVPGQPRRLPA
jgi:hypothetical protein